MKNKKCTQMAFFILTGSLLWLPLQSSWGESILKSELYENESLRTRLWLKFPVYSLNCLGLLVSTHDGPVYRMAGLETPFFCFGPVALEGLIKEVTNPLGYQATSLIYHQNISVQLNSSFQNKEQLGLVMGPFGLLPAFFIVTHEQAGLDSQPILESWGCFAPWTLSKSLKLDWLWMYAATNDQNGETGQEGSQPQTSLPCSLTTWAFRSRFKEDFPGGTLTANVTMALTNGLTERPGYFCTFQGALQTAWLEVHGLWGAASPTYLTIRHENPSLWQKAAFSGLIQLYKNYWLGGGYERRIFQTTGQEASVYLPTKETYTCKARANLPLSGREPLRELYIATEFEKENTWDEQGKLTEKNQLEATTRLALAPYQFSLNYQYKATTTQVQQVVAYCSYYNKIHECSLRLAQDFPSTKSILPPALELNGALKLAYQTTPLKSGAASHGQSLNWSRLYLKVKHQFKTGSISQWLLTIGWEVYWQ